MHKNNQLPVRPLNPQSTTRLRTMGLRCLGTGALLQTLLAAPFAQAQEQTVPSALQVAQTIYGAEGYRQGLVLRQSLVLVRPILRRPHDRITSCSTPRCRLIPRGKACPLRVVGSWALNLPTNGQTNSAWRRWPPTAPEVGETETQHSTDSPAAAVHSTTAESPKTPKGNLYLPDGKPAFRGRAAYPHLAALQGWTFARVTIRRSHATIDPWIKRKFSGIHFHALAPTGSVANRP